MDLQSVAAVVGTVLIAAVIRHVRNKKPPTGTTKGQKVPPRRDTGPRP